MMKEVLQGNLGLRETIQKQSQLIDEQNGEIFQLQNENDDLRERLQVLEDFTGKDSNAEMQKLVRDKKVLEKRVSHLEQTSTNFMNFQRSQREDVVTRSIVGKIRPNIEHVQHKNEAMSVQQATEEDFEPVRPTIEYDSRL